jgi:hypothetical protein
MQEAHAVLAAALAESIPGVAGRSQGMTTKAA